MFKTTSDFKSSRKSIFVYGQSGSGKTSLIKTLPGKVLVVNAENGLLSISDYQCDVYDLTVDKDNNVLPRTIRFDKLMYFLNNVLGDIGDKGYDWIVFDSLTEISQNLLESLKAKNLEGFKLWGEYSERMLDLTKVLRDLRPYNILILGHDSIEYDDFKRRFVTIDLNGKIANRLPALFDEIFYLRVNRETAAREIITDDVDNITAKDRSGKLKLIEEANLTNILNKMDS